MHRVTRPDAPGVFAENALRWRDQYVVRRADGPASFDWYVAGGVRARDIALQALRIMTAGHCAYCDGYPVFLGETIDHFRPKSTWPELAYDWGNLYVCCAQCQKRGDRFDEGLLRPDASDYAFDRYFECDLATGRLAPAGDASPDDQGRAAVTIQLFNLNHPTLVVLRRDAWAKRREPSTDEDPFRFLPPRLVPPTST